MKYFINFLEHLKKGNLKPVYLFHGEEVYLQNEAVKRLKESILTAESEDFNFDLVDGEEISAQDIVRLAQNPPFMASKRLVVVKNFPAFAPSKKDKREQKTVKEDAGKYKALVSYLENPSTSTCIVFTVFSAVDKRKKLVQVINKVGEVIDFTLLNKRDAGRWLMKQAKLYGKQFHPEALNTLLEGVKTDLNRLSNEINKIINFTGERTDITLEDVTQVVIPLVDLNIFNVVDAIGEKRFPDAVRGIKNLLLYREPPQRILAMIYRQFRLLLQCKLLLSEGSTAAEIQTYLKQHPFVVSKLIKQAKNFTVTELYRALTGLLEIDVAIKSGREEFYPAIESMIIKMSDIKNIKPQI